MTNQELTAIIDRLLKLPKETEWVEFKKNFHSKEEIGERISAISNTAKLCKQPFGYLIFGIEDGTLEILGTSFRCKKKMKGNEELEMWLINRLNPKIDVEMYDFEYKPGKSLAVFRIPATDWRPVSFLNQNYIRVGSITKKLMGYPEKEAKIWTSKEGPISSIIVKEGLSESDVVNLLSVETYFNLMKLPLPKNIHSMVERLKTQAFVKETETGLAITKLGAIVLAKDLKDFGLLHQKMIRIIVYKGKSKLETVREFTGKAKGYALGLNEWVDWIYDQIPAYEDISHAKREDRRAYPKLSIRELVANSLIHQDLTERGEPMVEIYEDRIEISNPGLPIINIDRFIEERLSRNEDLSEIMRTLGFFEGKGSGIDNTILSNEKFKLPAIEVILQEYRTIIRMRAFKPITELNSSDRRKACYQHACIKYVCGEKMTNQSLRERLGIESKNYPIVSRILKDAIAKHLIKEDDPENTSKRKTAYVPFWA